MFCRQLVRKFLNLPGSRDYLPLRRNYSLTSIWMEPRMIISAIPEILRDQLEDWLCKVIAI